MEGAIIFIQRKEEKKLTAKKGFAKINVIAVRRIVLSALTFDYSRAYSFFRMTTQDTLQISALTISRTEL